MDRNNLWRKSLMSELYSNFMGELTLGSFKFMGGMLNCYNLRCGSDFRFYSRAHLFSGFSPARFRTLVQGIFWSSTIARANPRAIESTRVRPTPRAQSRLEKTLFSLFIFTLVENEINHQSIYYFLNVYGEWRGKPRAEGEWDANLFLVALICWRTMNAGMRRNRRKQSRDTLPEKAHLNAPPGGKLITRRGFWTQGGKRIQCCNETIYGKM